MASVHEATLRPSKHELITSWLATQAWAPQGEAAQVGAYRFDDPAGKVGIEGFLLDVAGTPVHLILTYRGAPLEGADDFLLGTTEHSVLGRRWVYDGCVDPVAIRVLVTAVLSGGEQAELVVVKGEQEVGRREPTMRVRGSGSDDPESVALFDGLSIRSLGAVASVETTDYVVDVLRVLDGSHTVGGPATLWGVWRGGEGVLAAVTTVWAARG